ncbi:MAG: hypothetical protein PHU85_17450, partial [Phycisphaerae bacterium]|nr:hypothetical protein [Phycisphaerae bacterium]
MPSERDRLAPPSTEVIDGQLLVHPESVGVQVSLTRWFVLFAIWLIAAYVLMRYNAFGLGDTVAGFRLRMFMFLVLYMSLASTFVPLPVNLLIVWAAADSLGLAVNPGDGALARHTKEAIHWFVGSPHGDWNLAANAWARTILIAFVGAVATMMSNLNEYHILTAILRSRRVAAVRNARLYRVAIRWF